MTKESYPPCGGNHVGNVSTGPVVKRRQLLLALAAIAWCPLARTQSDEPQLGTPGKDAGWIPTPAGMVEAMLQMARAGASDYVVDLGSGDGRIPILAAKEFNARALGIELNPELVAYSVRAAAREGLADHVRFVHGDIFEVAELTPTRV